MTVRSMNLFHHLHCSSNLETFSEYTIPMIPCVTLWHIRPVPLSYAFHVLKKKLTNKKVKNGTEDGYNGISSQAITKSPLIFRRGGTPCLMGTSCLVTVHTQLNYVAILHLTISCLVLAGL